MLEPTQTVPVPPTACSCGCREKDPALAHFGNRVATELTRLIQWADAPPTRGQAATWYARMGHRIDGHRDRKDEAGALARHLDAELGHLWVFLLEEGVDPANNRAERALRFAVLRPPSPILVEAVTCSFQGKAPDVSWI